jgi:hypothetical protein
MVSTILPVHILANTVIVGMYKLMNNDLIYLILIFHVIAANSYLDTNHWEINPADTGSSREKYTALKRQINGGTGATHILQQNIAVACSYP